MRHELATPNRSASDQPAITNAVRSSCRFPISTKLTGSPGNPSPVTVKRGTRLRWRILSPIRTARGKTIGRDSVRKRQSQNGWQPLVRKSEDEHDQPDTKNAQSKN